MTVPEKNLNENAVCVDGSAATPDWDASVADDLDEMQVGTPMFTENNQSKKWKRIFKIFCETFGSRALHGGLTNPVDS